EAISRPKLTARPRTVVEVLAGSEAGWNTTGGHFCWSARLAGEGLKALELPVAWAQAHQARPLEPYRPLVARGWASVTERIARPLFLGCTVSLPSRKPSFPPCSAGATGSSVYVVRLQLPVQSSLAL